MDNQGLPRPREIDAALKLLWGALGIFGVWTLVELYRVSNIFEYQVIITSGFSSVIWILGIALFFVMISKGKNWARLTFLVFFTLGTLIQIWRFVMVPHFGRPFPINLLPLVIWGLWGCSLFLLFTARANIWFRRQ
jgi:hypothetical protein